MNEAARIFPVTRIDGRFSPKPWPWAESARAEIDAHFRKLRSEKPALWNGRVLMLHRHSIENGVFSAEFFETDYASFITWRDFGFPDRSVANGFAMGALRSSDGAYLLAEMGKQTANAGMIYFPAGTPDPGDIRDGKVDLEGSVLREVAEETGLTPGDFRPTGKWHAVCAGPRIGLMHLLAAREPAAALLQKINGHLAKEAAPELEGIVTARSAADFRAGMPDFIRAYLEYTWKAGPSF